MKIFSNEQIRKIEEYTLRHENLTTLDLIERAAMGIADEIETRWDTDTHIIVFAGWGNNGADALAASRILLQRGYNPEIHLFNIRGDRLSEENEACRNLLLEEFPDANLNEIVQKFDLPEISSDCLVIDGLFGRGLYLPVPQSISVIIRSINESGADIVAIDLPSGLAADWNANSINNNIIHATLTLPIEFPCLSFFFDDNAELVGSWKEVNVGLSTAAIKQSPYSYYLITDRDARRILKPRLPEATKHDFGSALICAGSYGMMGAAVLACRSCMRAGAGKVTCYAPKCGYHVMQTAVPSALFHLDRNDVAISEIAPIHNFDSVAIGPGIGTNDITINALENYLKVSNANGRPLILDADALNCIALRPIMLNYLPVMSVLTPHAGEFDRLFGSQPSSEARLRKAIEVASFHNVIIVLKSHYTAIVRPDGKVYFNSSGTPALATAGSGDVLTGIIAGLMAQGYTSETAALLAVFIHGVAGRMAEEVHGDYGTTAEDIANNTGRAIHHIMNS